MEAPDAMRTTALMQHNTVQSQCGLVAGCPAPLLFQWLFLVEQETMTADRCSSTQLSVLKIHVNGGYLDNSLNLGGAWGTALIPASEGAPSIALDAAVSGNILYGDLGLTTATGATLFLYGELTGMTPPIDFATMGPGTPMEWNATTVSALYGVDANAANAMRTLMMSVIYG